MTDDPLEPDGAPVDGAAEPDEASVDAVGDRVALAQAEADAAAEAAIDAGPSNAEYSVAFTPRNVAVGLAIVAGLVAFAASRRRRRSPRADD
jgi:hypothetical protein